MGQKNHEKLLEVVKQCRNEEEKRWFFSFVCWCYGYEVKNNVPVLLDIADLKEVIKQLEPKGSRNASAKYESIYKQAAGQADYLFGDRKRFEEIVLKVQKMYLDKDKN